MGCFKSVKLGGKSKDHAQNKTKNAKIGGESRQNSSLIDVFLRKVYWTLSFPAFLLDRDLALIRKFAVNSMEGFLF